GGTVRSYPKNTVVVSEGDQTDSLYVLLEGRVKAFVSDEGGREVVLNVIGRGDYFGELVLDGGPRSASILTLEPARTYIVPRAEVERLLSENPAFARDFTRRLISKVRSLTTQVRDLALKDVYARLAAFVEANAVEQGAQRMIPEKLTQNEIAARIGASREMVNRILKDLAAGGYVSVDGRQIMLHRKLPPHW
ncbi:MAG TPA: Crp/Fnr family transcriptional regulator, partial [Burkholderiales bacterium]